MRIFVAIIVTFVSKVSALVALASARMESWLAHASFVSIHNHGHVGDHLKSIIWMIDFLDHTYFDSIQECPPCWRCECRIIINLQNSRYFASATNAIIYHRILTPKYAVVGIDSLPQQIFPRSSWMMRMQLLRQKFGGSRVKHSLHPQEISRW